jgi:hypothetical protein
MMDIDDELSDDGDSSSDGGGGNTMMDLLSSYYGTEEKSTPISEGKASDIDSAAFSHTVYVKVIYKIYIFPLTFEIECFDLIHRHYLRLRMCMN